MCRKILLMSIILVCATAFMAHAEDTSAQSEKTETVQATTTVKFELAEKTRHLIMVYRRYPSLENKRALFKQVEANYNQVLEQKKSQLQMLKKTGKSADQIAKVQNIIDTLIENRKKIISQTMRRFTNEDANVASQNKHDEYVPVSDADKNLYIGYAPVTNAAYTLFVQETGHETPGYWVNGQMPADKEQHPVVNVSYEDAVAYCKWLSDTDDKYVYRLPTTEEWELAAGKMPKDAKINCGKNKGTTPVNAFEDTMAACGAVDMWGNVWEWTSTAQQTKRGLTMMTIKGGSWASPCKKSQTEYRWDAREPKMTENTIGFRVIREKRKK